MMSVVAGRPGTRSAEPHQTPRNIWRRRANNPHGGADHAALGDDWLITKDLDHDGRAMHPSRRDRGGARSRIPGQATRPEQVVGEAGCLGPRALEGDGVRLEVHVAGWSRRSTG